MIVSMRVKVYQSIIARCAGSANHVATRTAGASSTTAAATPAARRVPARCSTRGQRR
jgi:hypothetical protein